MFGIEQLIRNQQVTSSNLVNGSTLFDDFAPAERPAFVFAMRVCRASDLDGSHLAD
jgi:hypothetical protein